MALSYAFGGDTGLTHDQLQQRRKIAEQLLSGARKEQPKNWAQGLNNAADSIIGAVMRRKADEGLAAGKASADSAFGDLFGQKQAATDAFNGMIGGNRAYTPPPMTAGQEAASLGLDLGRSSPEPSNMVDGWDTGRADYAKIPEDIKNGIFAGESGGDYDALFGFSNRDGGRYSNVKLTDMTVDQALQFADPSGDYGQWVKGQVGRVATPMGAYQVVGKTLRAAKEGLGLTGNERMTQDLQDAIGAWIYQNQGTGAWEGYKGPQATPVNYTGGARQPQQAQSQYDMNQLLSLAANPYLSREQRGVVEALLKQEMQRSDPAYQLDMQYKRAQLDNLQNPPTDPTADMRNYQFAVKNGYDGSFTDYQSDIRKSSATNVSTTVNTGDQPDARPIVDKPDKGYQRRWDPENGTYVDEVIPGTDAARDIEQEQAKVSEKDRQAEIRLGTSLQNLQLNIDEIENGGLPVTGGIGAIGRMFPGSAATDFANRTQQITTRAALNEVQNMRDNSPTGGAVGQLTDSEREAIGLAATSLSNTSSRDEYLRAAKEYRRTVLDIAYGAGNWRMTDNGTVIVGSGAGAARSPAFSDMSAQDLLNVDIMTLDGPGMDAYEARMRELGL